MSRLSIKEPNNITPSGVFVFCFLFLSSAGLEPWSKTDLKLRSSQHENIQTSSNYLLFFLKILFIYLTETASERGNTSMGNGRGRSRLPAEEPDVGLDLRTLGSCPEPKADA